ncbi:DUF3592 domain-containing protein [Amycolatopsis sp. cg5]|uniref:DUF3592 domain-containing protein n=1 Tax=Amycolatopsis sp. cg5 TaxID=3238802 RepID=UPI003523300F
MTSATDFRRTTFLSVLGKGDDVNKPATTPAEPDHAPAAVARLRRRALRLVIAGLVLFIAAWGMVGFVRYRDADLLKTESRTHGVVFAMIVSGKFESIGIEYYTDNGVRRLEFVDVDDAGAYHENDPVTVIYDPADPTRIRTEADPELPGLVRTVTVVSTFLTIILVLSGLIGTSRWRRRSAAARAEPWRAGTATLARSSAGKARTKLRVRFQTEEQDYRTTAPVMLPIPPALFDRDEVKVWINGTGDAVTVMFEYGPFLVAAKRT